MKEKEYICKEDIRNELYEADAITMRAGAIISAFPAADVREVKKGHAVLKEDGRAHCSMCDTPGNSYVWNFCPNCGADMRGIDDV